MGSRTHATWLRGLQYERRHTAQSVRIVERRFELIEVVGCANGFFAHHDQAQTGVQDKTICTPDLAILVVNMAV